MPASRRTIALAATLAAAAAGCDRPQAIGDANAVIAVLPADGWAQLGPSVEGAFEERAFSVRDELIFRVTHTDPASRDWDNLRRFRQVLAIGRADDDWVAAAVERHRGPLPEFPAVLEVRDVWAQNQLVTAVVLPPGAELSTAETLLPAVGQRFLERYQVYARQRMFASGADTALADSLLRHHGFSVLLPEVYYGRQLEPNLFLFRNDHPDPSQLIRSILITWRTPAEAPVDGAAAHAWREQVAQRYYEPAQVTGDELISTRVGDALQIQGVWSNPPGEWPAAGPFITRVVPCPAQQRVYLVDTWLYAPGRDKYEYLVQLATLLDSFRCAEAA